MRHDIKTLLHLIDKLEKKFSRIVRGSVHALARDAAPLI